MFGRKLTVVCLGLLAAFGLLPQRTYAQATVNPTQAIFDQSPDHNATDGSGTPLVSSYQLEFYLVGGSAPFQTNSLGKPTPNGAGTITVNLGSMLIGWPVPGTNYFAKVAAVGPGGTSTGAQSNNFSFTGPCSYAISPTTQSIAAPSGSATTAVTAPSGCAWTATSNTSWITITSGASGTGNGTTAYTVAANTVTSPRTGTLTVAGQTLTVNQAAAPCTYSISPTTQSIAAAGSSSATTVTTSSNCNWTATSNASWITITTGSSGTGVADVDYAVAANTVTTPRTGTVTIAGQTLTVNQQAAACAYNVSPISQTLAAAGGASTTAVTTSSNCNWTATSNASWITITSGASSTGNGSVGFNAAVNTLTTPRTGTLTVAGQTFTVNQSAAVCNYSISPTSLSPAAAGTTSTTAVTTSSNCTWTATSNATWITVTSGASGTGNGTTGFSVAANTVTTPRTGSLTVAGQTFTVNQSAAACTYAISPTTQSIAAAGSSSATAVTTSSNCNWTATSNASWITITGGSSGTGNGSVDYAVAANTVTTPRTGTLTVAGQTLTVTQQAAACAYGVSPISQTLAAAGGASTTAVTTSSNCTWTATSNATWITVTSGASGTGNGTVGFTAAANTVTTPRTGTLTVAGQTFTVNQSAAACNYSISPTSLSPAAAGTTSTTAVTTSSNCTWTATSNATWITVTSGASGTGNGTTGFTVAANTVTSPRTGTLTVAGQTFTVNQSAAACTYAISPTTQSSAAAGGPATAAVTTTSGCNWTATSNASWITITSGSSGTDSGSVGYTVATNAVTTPRTGTVTIAGQTLTVNQQAAACAYGVSPTSQTLAAAGGASTTAVTTSSNCTWTATSNATWITVTSGASGTGNGTVGFTAAANTVTTPRTGTLTVAGQTFTVNQSAAACNYSISPTSLSPAAAGTTSTTAVTTSSNCTWTATSNATWITVTSGASGTGNGTTGFSVAANTVTTPRTGTLTVAGQTFTVNQSAAACTYAISPTTQSSAEAGGPATAAVTTTSGCNWTATSNASWITITSGSSGTDSGSVGYTVATNAVTTPRTGTVTIAGQTLTVNQQAAACAYGVSPTSQTLAAAGGASTTAVTTSSNCTWTATSNATWITVTSGASGTGNGTVGFTAAANTVTTPRTGTLTVAGQTFTVNQSAAACNYSISPTSLSPAAAGTTSTTAVTTSSNCTWTATSNATWITVTSGASGTGNGTTGFTVAANTVTSPRTGTLTVAGQTFTVNQGAAACTFLLSSTSQSVAAVGQLGTVGVTTTSGCSWTASSNASWITITSGSSGTDSGTVSYTVAANIAGIPRTGTLTVAGQTFTVNQSAAACLFSLSPTSQTVPASGSSASTTGVTATTGCSWTAASSASWITVTGGASGTGNGTVTYDVAVNTVTTPRTGTITVAGQVLTVNQSAAACNYSMSPASANVVAAGVSSSTAVTTTSGCAWTATSNTSWITVTSGSSGTGSGTVGFTVAANPSISQRSGSLTVAGQTFAVTQDGLICSYTASPTSQSMAAAGGSATTAVTTNSTGCAWTASSNAGWITITSGSSGTGNGTVGYTVAANTVTSPRSGTLTVGGQTVTINQTAAACNYAISPTSLSAAAGSSSSTTAVTTSSNCNWTATSNASWIAVTGGSSGTGNGTVGFDIAANTVTSPRSGTLTVAGQTFTVNQTAAACNYSISPTSANAVAAGASSSTAVTTSSGCAWTATSNTSWVTITSGSSGTSSGTVGFTVAANPSVSPRSGTLTVAGQTFAVTQDGVICSFSASPTSQSMAAAGGSATTAVTANSTGCAWTASSNAGWITITSGSSGTGNGTVGYTVAANTVTSPRSGTLTVGGQTVTINQTAAACNYAISPTSLSAAAGSSSSTTAVTTSSNCNWTATSNASWIAVTGGSSGTGNGTVGFDIAANTVTSPRSGTLTVAGQTFTVNQTAAACNYSISPTSANAVAAGASSSTAVTTSSGCAWTATSNTSWVTITSGSSGTSSGTVGFTVAANPSVSPRSGTLTVAGQTFAVTQDGVICSFSASPTSQSMAAAGGSATTAVTANSTGCAWTASSNAGWITITSGSSGTGNGTVAYTVAANAVTSPRSGTLTVGGQTVTINQTAANCNYSISPTVQSVAAAGSSSSTAVTTTSGCSWTATSNTSWITLSGGSSGTGNGTVTYDVAANTVTSPRTGTLTVAGQTLTVNQSAAAACSYSMSPTAANVVAAGVSSSTTVTAGSGCAWTATSNASWITITAGSSGSGGGTVSFTVAANTSITSRTGTLTVAGQTFTVTQDGVICSFSASPTSQNIAAAGSSATAAVTTPGGCAWTAASNAGWITITSGSNGTGNGTVAYTVGANTATSPRSGTLTVAGQTVTVNQTGAACTFAVSPISETSGVSGGPETVSVTTSSGCSWNSTSNSLWLTLTGGSSGNGSGIVDYTVRANTVTGLRTGSLVVAGQTVTVTQSGNCNYSLSSTTISIAATGATRITNVATTAGCSWTAVSNVSWITITGGSSGTNNGVVTYVIAPNTGVARTGTLTIAGQTVTVNEAGASTAVMPSAPVNVRFGQ